MKINYFTQNIKLSGELQKFLEDKINKLAHFSDKILQAQVDINYNPSHQKDTSLRLEINLQLPHKIARAVIRKPNLIDAIEAVEKKLKRQLEGLKVRREIKRKITRETIRQTKII